MSKITVALILGVIVVSSAGGYVLWQLRDDPAVKEENAQQVYDQAPEFSLGNYEGTFIESKQFNGRVRVINTWATWCPYCVNELPYFVALQKEFPDIVVMAINRAEPVLVAKAYTTSRLALNDEILFLVDPNDSFYKQIGGFAMPETLIIDRDNNIRVHTRGPRTLEELRAHVVPLLQ